MHAGPVSPRTEELLEERLGQRLGGEALTPQPYAPGRYRYTDSEEGTEPSEELLRSGRGIEAPARGQVDTESEEEGVGQMRGDFFAEGEQRQMRPPDAEAETYYRGYTDPEEDGDALIPAAHWPAGGPTPRRLAPHDGQKMTLVFGGERDLGLVLGSDDPLDQLWLRLDTDGDGSLGRPEVVQMLVAMGRINDPNDPIVRSGRRGADDWPLQMADDKAWVDGVLSELDSDGSGDIDIGEFEDWYRQQDDAAVQSGTVHEPVYIAQAGAYSAGRGLKKGMAILSIQGKDARTMSLREVTQALKDAGRPLTLEFDPQQPELRSPARWQEDSESWGSSSEQSEEEEEEAADNALTPTPGSRSVRTEARPTATRYPGLSVTDCLWSPAPGSGRIVAPPAIQPGQQHRPERLHQDARRPEPLGGSAGEDREDDGGARSARPTRFAGAARGRGV